jgi:hypothetical protein
MRGTTTILRRRTDVARGWPAGQFAGSNADMTLGTAERRLLARMPLHAITSVHGEPGLRERLAIETASFPPADRDPRTRTCRVKSNPFG